jgi:hypothetical protein
MRKEIISPNSHTIKLCRFGQHQNCQDLLVYESKRSTQGHVTVILYGALPTVVSVTVLCRCSLLATRFSSTCVFGMRNIRLVVFCSCLVLLAGKVLHAHAACSVEAKLLLFPTDTRAAVASLNTEQEKIRRVYFFDTSTLELLRHGIIIRLRQDARSGDLAIKLRPPATRDFLAARTGADGKCEIDRLASGDVPSSSLTIKYRASNVPEQWADLSSSLSAAQRRLLSEVNVQIDWNRVRKIAEIKSTTWRCRGLPEFPQLTLELWEAPTGTILELSARLNPNTADSAYTNLQRLAIANGLHPATSQKPKSSIVLERFSKRNP